MQPSGESAVVIIGPLDINGSINVRGSLDFNGNRISNYQGFPKADLVELLKDVGPNQERMIDHGFKSFPSLVQVWVSHDEKGNVGSITKKKYGKDLWRMSGMMAHWDDNGSWGTAVESVNTENIVIRTGTQTIWHGHIGQDYIKIGKVSVKAWK